MSNNSFTPQEIEQFLQQFFDVVGARQYIGARYVPIFGRAGSDTVEWDDLAPYEPLTVVMHDGVSYVSRRYVPVGIEISDTNYWVQTYRFNAQVEQYRQQVLAMQDDVDNRIPFPDPAFYPRYGELGQVLSTLTDGTVKWQDPVVPSDEQAEEVITAWLDDHPEATTTVQDGSITTQKLADNAVTFQKMDDDAKSNPLDSLRFNVIRNLYNVSNVVLHAWLNPTTGAIESLSSSNWCYSPTFIPMTAGTHLVSSHRACVVYYDRHYNVISALQLDATTKKTVVPSDNDIRYVRFAASDADPTAIVVQVGDVLDSNNTQYEFALDGLCPDPDTSPMLQHTSLLNFRPGTNIFNSYNVVLHAWLNPTTGYVESLPVTTNWCYSPTFIPMTAGTHLVSSHRACVVYYDRHYNVISALQLDATTKKTVVPSDNDIRYVRFAASDADPTAIVVQVGDDLTTSEAYTFQLDGLIVKDESETIIVSQDGSGDYTSFTQAIYDNFDKEVTVIIRAGIYDIESEYVALFGQSVVSNLSDATTGIKNFQRGVNLTKKHLIFDSGSKVVCDWTSYTVDATHRFSAINVNTDVVIENLYLVATNTWYCIHDDGGGFTPFENRYENCHIEGYTLKNANCIGGGCSKYSRHILSNCYLNNHVTSTDVVLAADARFHNTSTPDAEPVVLVRNCYFSNNFNVTYYGTQTTKMRAYVNNCFAPQGIIKRAESSAATTDNVELYAWNNQGQ